jgi:hypothetical protein
MHIGLLTSPNGVPADDAGTPLHGVDDMGPVLLAACATVAFIEIAGLLKPDRGVTLSIIAVALGLVLLASIAVRAAGLWRREREARRAREAEDLARRARADRLLSIAHELRGADTESAIHRRFIEQASLVVAHDESDLVVFPPEAGLDRARAGSLTPDVDIEGSALEQRVAETGDAAYRTTLDRGRPCYQVAVPVHTNHGLLAVLTLRRAVGSFTAGELDAAMSLCSQVGIALERARLSATRGLLAT